MKQMLEIVDVLGREILDSRGNPTVEVEIVLEDGTNIPISRSYAKNVRQRLLLEMK